MLVRINFGIAAMMAGILLLAAFQSQSNRPTTGGKFPIATGELVSAQLAPFYGQNVAWTRCGASICAWIRVPVDYDNPGGATIRLRVKFRPAGSGHAKGSLFINPGGPGGSGVDYVDGFLSNTSKSIRDVYNVVGFDPRGVGRSAPLLCLPGSAFDKVIRLDPSPDDLEEVTNLEAGFRSIGKACVQNSGALASHVSTAENARDLDILRSLVGDRHLNFYGASYGTQLGATYADMYPASVGKMILDGGVDPDLSKERQGAGQNYGFERALRSFLRHCVSSGNCPLGKDVDSAELDIQKLLLALDAKPMRTQGNRQLTEGGAIYGIAFSLYGVEGWGGLTAALERTHFGDGTGLLSLSDQYFGRRTNGTYKNNGSEATYAVRCLDFPRTPSRADILQLIPSYVKASPVFGRVMAWTAAECADWPAKSTTPQRSVQAKGAAPILVIGTTRDPATPYEWSKSLAKELDSGILVTRHGDGHTGYGVGNSCVDRTVNAYLAGARITQPLFDCPE